MFGLKKKHLPEYHMADAHDLYAQAKAKFHEAAEGFQEAAHVEGDRIEMLLDEVRDRRKVKDGHYERLEQALEWFHHLDH